MWLSKKSRRSPSEKSRAWDRDGAVANGHIDRPLRERLGRPGLRIVSRLYEQRLVREVRRRPMPHHVGIILDGNRRYGRAHSIADPVELYSLGARKLDDVLGWCIELKIAAVTLWLFSAENFTRPAAEVAGILSAIEGKLRALARDNFVHRHRVRVRALGRLAMLPETVVSAITAAEHATEGYDGMELNFAVAYGGRQEIVDATKAFLHREAADGVEFREAIARICPEAISEHLYTAGLPDPDLIIRTSGEIQLSGFLLWQSAHSEFYFTDVPWPAFRKIDFLRAIRAFQDRKRRFGR